MSHQIMHRRGFMFVLSSPSGAGKTTISRALLKEDENLSMSVSVTTRKPRSGEVDGTDYHFITMEAYDQLISEDGMLEHANIFGNFYGTPRAEVEAKLAAGMDVVFDIDWQGTQQLKETARDDLVSVFILPPSHKELEQRLRGRAQDTEEVVRMRMTKASDEMSHWPEYDYVVINDQFMDSITRIRAILLAERHRRFRQAGLVDFVNAMRSEDA